MRKFNPTIPAILIGSIVFFVISFSLFMVSYIYYSAYSDYVNLSQKTEAIRIEMSKKHDEVNTKQISNKANKEDYLTLRKLYEEHIDSTQALLTPLNDTQNTLIVKSFPELQKYFATYKDYDVSYLAYDNILIKYLDEAVKDSPDTNLLNDLGKQIPTYANKLAKLNTETFSLPQKISFINLIFNNLWSMLLGVLLLTINIILFAVSIYVFVRRVLSKKILAALGWFMLALLNIVSFLGLILAALMF